MIRHLPMLSATVIPAGGLLLVATALRPDSARSVRHRPGSGPDLIPVAAVVSRLAAERRAGLLPASRFGHIDLTYPGERRTLRARELTR